MCEALASGIQLRPALARRPRGGPTGQPAATSNGCSILNELDASIPGCLGPAPRAAAQAPTRNRGLRRAGGADPARDPRLRRPAVRSRPPGRARGSELLRAAPLDIFEVQPGRSLPSSLCSHHSLPFFRGPETFPAAPEMPPMHDASVPFLVRKVGASELGPLRCWALGDETAARACWGRRPGHSRALVGREDSLEGEGGDQELTSCLFDSCTRLSRLRLFLVSLEFGAGLTCPSPGPGPRAWLQFRLTRRPSQRQPSTHPSHDRAPRPSLNSPRQPHGLRATQP